MVDEIRQRSLLIEYQEIGNSTRHYANLQFAQMSIFVAVAGGIIAAIGSAEMRNLDALRWTLCSAGALFGVLFALMSLRVNDYWDKHVKRAREIETELEMSSYLNPPTLRSGVKNRTAVMGFCVLVIVTFLVVAHVVP